MFRTQSEDWTTHGLDDIVATSLIREVATIIIMVLVRTKTIIIIVLVRTVPQSESGGYLPRHFVAW